MNCFCALKLQRKTSRSIPPVILQALYNNQMQYVCACGMRPFNELYNREAIQCRAVLPIGLLPISSKLSYRDILFIEQL